MSSRCNAKALFLLRQLIRRLRGEKFTSKDSSLIGRNCYRHFFFFFPFFNSDIVQLLSLSSIVWQKSWQFGVRTTLIISFVLVERNHIVFSPISGIIIVFKILLNNLTQPQFCPIKFMSLQQYHPVQMLYLFTFSAQAGQIHFCSRN